MSCKLSLPLIARPAALLIALALCLALAEPQAGGGQAPEARPPAANAAHAADANAAAGAADQLGLQQQQIADRYKHLEEVLLRMGELTAASDPRRAALLRKAVAQGKEQLIAAQLEQLVKLLEKDQLSRAIENQQQLDKDLRALLELLLSENRAKRIESEKARIAQYLKRLNQILKEQKSVQGRSGGGDDAKRLAAEQAKLADNTGNLAKDIRANEEGGTGGQSGPGAQAQAEGKQQPQAQTPGQDQGQKDGPGKGQGPGQGKAQAQPDEQPKGQDQNPARTRLEAAQQRMREAQQKLDEAKRKDAVQQQEEAIRELEQAKAHLEEILRQLREEEMGRVLATLEIRFRKMLQLQRDVLEGTLRLDKVPDSERTHSHEIEASRLSSKQSEIVLEADKALLLLREEGTAVAFPEAVAQIRQDMQQVAQRLAEAKVGKITQSLEEDIITALEEMIDALKKAQKDLDDKKQRLQLPSGELQEPALVDLLAELKMIRTLQMRVNSRTERYSKLIEGEQAGSAELLEALRSLAERQQRIHQITKDLELGKNR